MTAFENNDKKDNLTKSLHNFKSMAELLQQNATSQKECNDCDNNGNKVISAKIKDTKNLKSDSIVWSKQRFDACETDMVSLHTQVHMAAAGEDEDSNNVIKFHQDSDGKSKSMQKGIYLDKFEFCDTSDMNNLSDSEIDIKKSKRKQLIPKFRNYQDEIPAKVSRLCGDNFQQQLNILQQQLQAMQDKIINKYSNTDCPSSDASLNLSKFAQVDNGCGKKTHVAKKSKSIQTDLARNNENFFNKGEFSKSLLTASNEKIYKNMQEKLIQVFKKRLQQDFAEKIESFIESVIIKTMEELQYSNIDLHDVKNVNFTDLRTTSSNIVSEQAKTSVLPASVKHANNTIVEKNAESMDNSIGKVQPHALSFCENNKLFDNTQRMFYNSLVRQKSDSNQGFDILNKVKMNDRFSPHFYTASQTFSDFMPSTGSSWFPTMPIHPYSHSSTSLHTAFSMNSAFNKEQEQTEAIPLIVNSPKKKRTKVTDTRLSPRAARALLQEPVPAEQPPQFPLSVGNSMKPTIFDHKPSVDNFLSKKPSIGIPNSLPTSVAIPNPSLKESDIYIYNNQINQDSMLNTGNVYQSNQDIDVRDRVGKSGSNGFQQLSHSDPDSPNMLYTPSDSPCNDIYNEVQFHNDDVQSYDAFPHTSTLTPMHLRKAKLMFFYVRYPSSSILKVFFPDVKFNKNNTAQLVKWFSNFREFYYIQMEKYARQALGEGVKSSEELIVNTDSELYRVLNLHYNRNHQLEIPENFRVVVQATLREFFKAIEMNKDTEQSWKKPIYKIIARMDDTVPDYFKTTNWLEQLNL